MSWLLIWVSTSHTDSRQCQYVDPSPVNGFVQLRVILPRLAQCVRNKLDCHG